MCHELITLKSIINNPKVTWQVQVSSPSYKMKNFQHLVLVRNFNPRTHTHRVITSCTETMYYNSKILISSHSLGVYIHPQDLLFYDYVRSLTRWSRRYFWGWKLKNWIQFSHCRVLDVLSFMFSKESCLKCFRLCVEGSCVWTNKAACELWTGITWKDYVVMRKKSKHVRNVTENLSKLTWLQLTLVDIELAK